MIMHGEAGECSVSTVGLRVCQVVRELCGAFE